MKKRPASAKAVITQLTKRFDEFPAALQVAARLLIDHPRDVGLYSMRKLATRASVHPNAFVRLAKELGFDGYDELRERFRDFTVTDELGGFGARSEWLHGLHSEGGTSKVVAQMAEATAENLQRGLSMQEVKDLEQVCEWIVEANHVYVLGVGAAYSLAHQFWYVARMAFEHLSLIPRLGSHPLDDLAYIKQQDVLLALTFQPYRTETIAALELARKKGLRVVGITDSAASPVARDADISLVCPTHTPHFFSSHAAVTALLETLIAVLVAQAPASVGKRIEAFHAQRESAGLYIEERPIGARA